MNKLVRYKLDNMDLIRRLNLEFTKSKYQFYTDMVEYRSISTIFTISYGRIIDRRIDKLRFSAHNEIISQLNRA